mmetsp:Transcript_5198/g.18683  ORF Transcript_5198/g.18683 Transcript_5198/m.18683 type:complete len:324 (+) Transcript_5198:3952-4923(+)
MLHALLQGGRAQPPERRAQDHQVGAGDQGAQQSAQVRSPHHRAPDLRAHRRRMLHRRSHPLSGHDGGRSSSRSVRCVRGDAGLSPHVAVRQDAARSPVRHVSRRRCQRVLHDGRRGGANWHRLLPRRLLVHGAARPARGAPHAVHRRARAPWLRDRHRAAAVRVGDPGEADRPPVRATLRQCCPDHRRHDGRLRRGPLHPGRGGAAGAAGARRAHPLLRRDPRQRCRPALPDRARIHDDRCGTARAAPVRLPLPRLVPDSGRWRRPLAPRLAPCVRHPAAPRRAAARPGAVALAVVVVAVLALAPLLLPPALLDLRVPHGRSP